MALTFAARADGVTHRRRSSTAAGRPLALMDAGSPAALQHAPKRPPAALPPLLVAAERVAATVAQGVHGRRRVGQGETFWQFRAIRAGRCRRRASTGARAPSRSGSMSARPNGRRRRASGSGATPRPRWTTPRRRELPTKRAARRSAGPGAGGAAGARRRAGDAAGLAACRPPRPRRARPPGAADRPRRRSRRASLPVFEPLPRYGQLVLIGDLLAPLDGDPAAGRALRRRAACSGHLLQVLDPAEETLPFAGRVRFEGLEQRGAAADQPRRDACATQYVERLAAASRRAGRDRPRGRLELRHASHRPAAAHGAAGALYRAGARRAGPADRRCWRSAPSPSPRPGCLLGFAVLPVLWWLLRVTPPAPRRVRFPALRLLLGLVPREETPARTPLWLILLRMALAALIILALAHPLLNPERALAGERTAGARRSTTAGRGAAMGRARSARSTGWSTQAEREDRRVVLLDTAPLPGDAAAPPLSLLRARRRARRRRRAGAAPWPADRGGGARAPRRAATRRRADDLWLSDGLEDGDRRRFRRRPRAASARLQC